MSEKTERKKNRIIVLVMSVIMVMLVGAVVVMALKMNSKNSDVSTNNFEETAVAKRPVLINEDNAESMVEDLLKKEETPRIPVSHFMTDMTTVWHFSDGESVSGDAYVGNSEFNSTDVYFDVMRKDNNELIYVSPVIPLGSSIDEIKLNEDLDAGSYPCVLTYTLVDDDQTPISTLNVAVDIIIES